MTSYVGIIRIRLRVEVRLLPLSLHIQAPLHLFDLYYISNFKNIQQIFLYNNMLIR